METVAAVAAVTPMPEPFEETDSDDVRKIIMDFLWCLFIPLRKKNYYSLILVYTSNDF